MAVHVGEHSGLQDGSVQGTGHQPRRPSQAQQQQRPLFPGSLLDTLPAQPAHLSQAAVSRMRATELSRAEGSRTNMAPTSRGLSPSSSAGWGWRSGCLHRHAIGGQHGTSAAGLPAVHAV